jgi:hypothetical protein
VVSEQGDSTVNPGQVIYDDLSDEAKAAVNRLPDSLFEDKAGVSHVELFVESIRIIHVKGPRIWSLLATRITNSQDFVGLNVQNFNVISLSDKLRFVVDRDAVRTVEPEFDLDRYVSFSNYQMESLVQVEVDDETPVAVREEFERAYRDLVQRLATANWTKNGQHHNHRDDIRIKLALLSGEAVPAPGYVEKNRFGLPKHVAPGETPPPDIDLPIALTKGFASAGLTYTPLQIASFYTALQTKGFVILSGISGTGKSKIAQRFADMLPDITANVALPLVEDYVRIAVQPYMKKYKRIRLWNEVSEGLPVPPNGTSVMVPFTLDGRKGKCRVWNRPETNAGTYIFPQGELGQEFKDLAVDHFAMRFHIDENEDRIASIEMRTELPIEPDAGVEGESRLSNRLFLSVRPDWRDGKALIGYHNPLSGEYQRTQFLDFVIAAGDDYTAGNRNAFFVILDEMNLAHVEYYFADVLSVIESGRDEEGWTVEGISLSIGEADADLPETLKLPPNLYIVGTVNMDETTHPFSPKVLDRAFTIELTEVDFIGYPPEKSEASESGDDDRQALLRTFTQNGRYPRIDKGDIREVVDRPERFGVDLQSLNLSLRRSRMHFGYRVFDEIMQFVFNAEENGLFTSDEAFDHAVLMKVLPKFNGSRAKLQTALFELLHWCHKAGTMSSDDRADLEARFAKLTDDHTSFDTVVPKDLEAVEDQWRYPATGRRAALMMQDLYTDGFAAFG